MSAGTRDSAAASTGPVREATGNMEPKVGAGEPESTATTPPVGRHTPGPWRAVYDHDMGRVDRVRGADKVDVAVPLSDTADVAVPTWGPRSAAEINANAHLIAAAPRMYDRMVKLADSGDVEATEIVEAIHGRP